MTLVNQFYMNLDIKRRFERYVATFRSGDNVELIMSIFDNGKEYDISQATSATIYQKTCSGISLKGEGTFDTIDGKRVIRYTLEKLYTIENGFNTMILVIGDGTKEVSVQPFNIYINNDLTAKSGSYIDLIQDIMIQIEDLTFKLENTIKNEEKGVPNGVALSDEYNEVPMDIIPLKFKRFLDHIPQTVYEHQVHGMRVNMDGILQHDTAIGNWVDTVVNTKYENEGSDTGYLKVDISIKDDIITLKYSGGPKVELQKWASGKRGNAYFKSNGNSFTGLTFNVPQNGDYTLWYTDNNGNEYTKLFKVSDVEEEIINVDIDVVDGIVNIITDADVAIKKWDEGERDIPYFQSNGNVITGTNFEVTEVGTYTVYIKTNKGTESVHVFEVTESQLKGVEITINVVNGVVNISHEPNLEISVRKFAYGIQVIEFFADKGNPYEGNSFEINRTGNLTIYHKYINGTEAIKSINVTQDMLPPSPDDDTPPTLDITLSGAYGDGNKTGAVIALVRIKDDESGISHLILPNGTRVDNPSVYSEHKLTTNGNHKFTVFNNAGLSTEETITVSNIGTGTRISQMPLGTRFSYCGMQMVLIEKNNGANTIVQYANQSASYNRIAFDYDGSTNLFPNASISSYLTNNFGLYDTLGGENDVIVDAQWSYGLVYHDGNKWTHYTNEYAPNFSGLLTVPQFETAINNGWLNYIQGDKEWTLNQGTTGTVYTIDIDNSNNLLAIQDSVTNLNDYRIAYQVNDNAIGYR